MNGKVRSKPEESFQVTEISAEEDTLPKLLRRNYLKHPDDDALRVKDRGIWVTYTWRDYYEAVKYFCLGLISLGLERGDKVAVIGENKPEWYWAELAAQAAGAVATGIFVDCGPEEVKYFIQASDAKFLVAHDQEQVDKALAVKDKLPGLKKVIYWDPKGLWSYDDPILMTFEAVQALGRELEKDQAGLFERKIEEGSGDDVGIISWTSGTTGLPKGAMLGNKFLVNFTMVWSQVDHWFGKGYEYVSFIPPAWATEQAVGIAGSLLADLVVNFPEEPETVQEDLREIGPHVLFYGARQWEMVNRMVQAKMIDASFLRRLIYRTFLPVGLKMADSRIEQNRPGLGWRLLYFLAYQAVLRSLRDRLGLSKVKVAYSGGGALSPEIIRYFLALGVEIKLVYGSTEMGLVSIPREGALRPETSGQPLPWVKIKIAENGEILVKHEYMFAGYYKNPEATRKNFDEEGWYHTGDFGYLDEHGHLIVIDRMEDLKPLAGGKQFSPQYAEVRLRFSPYIKDVIVVGGEDVEFVTALINIDIDNVGRFADAKKIVYTTFTDLSQKPEVIDLVKQEIQKLNRTLPEYARIKRFVNLHKEFDPDEAELTRTRKLRRTFVEERYRELIDALYGDRDEVPVEAQVTYRDGRSGVIRTVIKVNTL